MVTVSRLVALLVLLAAAAAGGAAGYTAANAAHALCPPPAQKPFPLGEKPPLTGGKGF